MRGPSYLEALGPKKVSTTVDFDVMRCCLGLLTSVIMRGVVVV